MPATLDSLEVWLKTIADDHRDGNKILERIAGGAGPSGPSGPTNSPAVPNLAEKLTGAMDKVAKAAGATQVGLIAFAGAFDRVLSSLGGAMTKFVALANPAAVFRFNIAVENAMSAVGRILLPALERFTIIIQQLGNAIESLSPEAKRLVGGLAMGGGLAGALSALATAGVMVVRALGGPITLLITFASVVAGVMATTASGKSIMESFGKVMKAFGSIVEVLARALLPIIEVFVVPIFVKLAEVLEEAANAAVVLTNRVRAMFDLAPIDYDPNKKTAVAARQGSFGDLRGAANRAYSSAFNTTAANIAQEHLKATQETNKWLRLINENLGAGVPGSGLGKTASGRELSMRASLGAFGKAIAGDEGATVGRVAGGVADNISEPFVSPYRWLGRMAGVLK